MEATANAKFAFFNHALWNGLNEAGKQGTVHEFIKMIQGDFDAFATPGEGYDSAKELMGELGVTANRKEFDKYNTAITSQEEAKLISDPNFNKELYTFLIAVRRIRNEIEGIQVCINVEGAVQYGDLLVVPGFDNPFFESHAEDIKDITKVCYSQLVSGYEEKIAKSFLNKRLVWSTEVHEFERLFRSGEDDLEWEYLASRLHCTEAEVRELYLNRIPVINGDYIRSFFQKDPNQRIVFGKLWAIQEYRDYLTENPPINDKISSASGKPTAVTTVVGNVDNRIELDEQQRDYIKRCFYLFALDKNGLTSGKPLMPETDIDKLLQVHFIGFGDASQRDERFSLPLQKTHLAHFLNNVLTAMYFRKKPKRETIEKFKNIMYSFEGFTPERDTDNISRYFRGKPSNYPSYFERKINEYKMDLSG